MTPDRFSVAINRLLLPAFPDLAAYVAQLPAETKDAWKSMFADVDESDLLAVIHSVKSGELVIHAYERERLAVILFREAKAREQLRREKLRKRAHNESLLEQSRRPEPMSEIATSVMDRIGCGDAYREILRRCDAGEDRVEVTRDVLSRTK